MEIILLSSIVSSLIVVAKHIKNNLKGNTLNVTKTNIEEPSTTVILDEDIPIPTPMKVELNSGNSTGAENLIAQPVIDPMTDEKLDITVITTPVNDKSLANTAKEVIKRTANHQLFTPGKVAAGIAVSLLAFGAFKFALSKPTSSKNSESTT